MGARAFLLEEEEPASIEAIFEQKSKEEWESKSKTREWNQRMKEANINEVFALISY